MPPTEVLLGAAILAGLVAYVVLAGADFGGGVWDALATGPRAPRQRAAIAEAIGPVWEANHVWLIFVIVLLFSAFPTAYAALSVALFVPFHLVLLGIILRGSAFVFRAYSRRGSEAGYATGWTRVFGVASAITPFVLGMALGAVSAGSVRFDGGRLLSGYWAPWLTPLSFAVGALTVVVAAYLAAVYLTLETRGELREDFRRRALGTAAVGAAVAALTLGLIALEAPHLWEGLVGRASALIVAGVALAAASAWAVWARRYRLARAAAVGQVAALIVGWALAQYPYVLYPDVTLAGSAAPVSTQLFILWSLVPGALVLAPSLWYLFRVFKRPVEA